MTPSATVADNSDSIAPNTAMVMAGATNSLMVSHERTGTTAPGNWELMLNLSPIVSILLTPAYCLSNNATTVITTMATNEPGIRLLYFGMRAMMTTLANPTNVLHTSILRICWKYTIHFSTKSLGTSVICIPNKSFI